MARKQMGGFTLIEAIITIAVFVIVLPPIVGMITSAGYINKRSNDHQIIDGLAEQKLESLRSRGYDNLANGTTDFSSDVPAQLGTPHGGSYTISDQSATLKKVVLTIDYTTQGQSLSQSYTAYVGKHGLGQ